MRWWFVLLAALLFASPATAQRLVADLSEHHISLESSFTGTEIVVFGIIEGVPDDGRDREFEVAVVVEGPPVDLTVRRKEQVFGIWMNTEAVSIEDLPSFYYVASSAPYYELMSPSRRARYTIGTDVLGLPETQLDPMDIERTERFRRAMVALREGSGLVVEDQAGVVFPSEHFFRARIPIPPTVHDGTYEVTVYLFERETVIGAQSAPLVIDKTGIEGRLFTLAHENPFLYGLLAVVMALLIGWGSTVIFRQT